MLIRYAIKEFLIERKYQNISPNLVKAYELLFETFTNWTDENDYQKIQDINTRAVKAFLS